MVIFDSDRIRYFVLLTSLFHMLTGIILFMRTYLSSQRKFKYDSLFSILDKLISTLILGVFIYVFKDLSITLNLFIFIQLISIVISMILLIYSINERWLFNLKISQIRLDWIKSALPYTVLILLMSVYTRVDSTLIQLLLENKFAGIYAASYRLIDFMSQYGYLSSVILLPLFSSLKEEGNKNSVLLIFTTHFMMISALLVSMFFIFYSDVICEILYKERSAEISTIFKLHLISYPFTIINFILGSYITAHKQIKFLIWISFIGVIIQLIGNNLLLRYFGLPGACYVMIFTQFWIFCAQILWIMYIHRITSIFPWDLLLVFLFGLGTLVVSVSYSDFVVYLTLLFVGSVVLWIFRRRNFVKEPVFDLLLSKLKRRS